MNTIKLKTRVLSLKENDVTEKVKNGDDYVSIKVAAIVDKINETGDIVKTNFINFKKVSLLENLSILNKDIKKATKLCDVNTALTIADLVVSGAEVTINRDVYQKGEKSPIQNLEFDKPTIINSINIDDNELIVTDEDFRDEINAIIIEGKDIRRKADEEKALLKKAAKEALLAKLALAAEPEPTSEPEPEPKDE